MRKMILVAGLAALLGGCADDAGGPSHGSVYAYDDWIYHPYGWYDDPFWIWVDNNPDCCDSGDDIKESLEDWWNDLDEGEQDDVRDKVGDWLDDHGLEPAEGETMQQFVLDTASERWETLTPEERQQWLSGRDDRIEKRRELAQDMTPEQRAALEAKLDSVTPEQREAARARLEQSYQRPSTRQDRFQYRMSNHPVPRRSAVSASPRFRAARSRAGGRRR